MSIPLFLAMTGEEIRQASSLPENIAWMSCHFSAGGPGLVDTPTRLPTGSMLILDDRIPFRGHDSSLICAQLRDLLMRFQCSRLLLDFERPLTPALHQLVQMIVDELPCPVGVPREYADEINGPVFLPPVPPQIPAAQYLQPYRNREIWLEVAMDGACATVTSAGCHFEPVAFPSPQSPAHRCRELNCHYSIDIQQNQIRFHFKRGREDVERLLEEAGQMAVTIGVGLYQELSATRLSR